MAIFDQFQPNSAIFTKIGVAYKFCVTYTIIYAGRMLRNHFTVKNVIRSDFMHQNVLRRYNQPILLFFAILACKTHRNTF